MPIPARHTPAHRHRGLYARSPYPTASSDANAHGGSNARADATYAYPDSHAARANPDPDPRSYGSYPRSEPSSDAGSISLCAGTGGRWLRAAYTRPDSGAGRDASSVRTDANANAGSYTVRANAYPNPGDCPLHGDL